MERPTVPTAEQLKGVAVGDNLAVILQLAASEVPVIHTLVNVGEATRALRLQAQGLHSLGTTDKVSVAILEAHVASEVLLDRCAEAAHLVLCDLARRASAENN
jgi:hypothetical protein